MKSKVLLCIFLKVYAVLIAYTNGADIPEGLSEHGHAIEEKLHQGNFEGENKKIQREKLFIESARNNKGDIMKSQDNIKMLEKKFNKNSGLRKVFMPNKHRKMKDKIDVHKMENDDHLNTLRKIFSDRNHHERQGNLPAGGPRRITDASGVHYLPG